MPNVDAAQIKRNGWRQGAILPPTLVRKLKRDEQIPSLTLPVGKRRITDFFPAFIHRCGDTILFWAQAGLKARLEPGDVDDRLPRL